MNTIRVLLLTAGLLFALALPGFSENTLEQANSSYSSGDYEKALELYQQALDEEGESAAVYYNMGNCYYRLNRVAPSILNYERALLLNPGDRDIRFNLEIARLKAVDRIEPVGEFFLSSWLRSLSNLMGTDAWSHFSITFFVLLIVAAFLFFFSRIIILKKIGFYVGLLFLALVIAGNVFARIQKKELTERNFAIIFTPTITIKSSPDNSGTDLFILHEGTKVQVISSLGGWNEIETADGNVGWIRSEEIEVI